MVEQDLLPGAAGRRRRYVRRYRRERVVLERHDLPVGVDGQVDH
ncbi:hypothetical protein ACWKT3_00500 [Streptomyces violaceus]